MEPWGFFTLFKYVLDNYIVTFNLVHKNTLISLILKCLDVSWQVLRRKNETHADDKRSRARLWHWNVFATGERRIKQRRPAQNMDICALKSVRCCFLHARANLAAFFHSLPAHKQWKANSLRPKDTPKPIKHRDILWWAQKSVCANFCLCCDRKIWINFFVHFVKMALKLWQKHFSSAFCPDSCKVLRCFSPTHLHHNY